MLDRGVKLILLEDNTITVKIIRAGEFPKLQHFQRTRSVNIRWLLDCLQRRTYYLEDCHTQRMAAGIFTKAFPV